MPYRTVYTTKLSLCGDTYTETNVIFDEVIEHINSTYVEPMDEVIDSDYADYLISMEKWLKEKVNTLRTDYNDIPF